MYRALWSAGRAVRFLAQGPVHNGAMRRTETGPNVYFRSEDRIRGSDWYFQSREGDQGPFATCEEAERELKVYVETMELIKNRAKALVSGDERQVVALED